MIMLSIYIATYNRKEILRRKIDEMLAIKSDDFDVWVLDDCSNDGTVEMLSEFPDTRLHYIQNKERVGINEDGAMPNWYRLLEACDGRFALHLNDRDIFYTNKLPDLIKFLKNHMDYSGGICDSFSGIKYYDSPEEALMEIPYKASHPTGVVFRTDLYKTIAEREKIFEKETSYIHPHDLVLGKLSEGGKMFRYNKIFELADTESFAKNKSFYYNKGTEKTSWFAPAERLKEFQMFIKHMENLSFTWQIKEKKAIEIAKSYLYFCTFNYKYYITDPGQTQHYGIEVQPFGRKRMICCAEEFIEKSSGILNEQHLLQNISLYKIKMNTYFYAIYILKPLWDIYKKGANRKW